MARKEDAEKMFRDVWNPTREEILRWAYTPHVPMPDQDFELAVYSVEFHDLILACAADPACPHRYFFLRCLYIIVGDAVRTQWNVFSQAVVMHLIDAGRQIREPDIQMWVNRSTNLLAEPKGYTYNQWGLGSSFAYEAQHASMESQEKRTDQE